MLFQTSQIRQKIYNESEYLIRTKFTPKSAGRFQRMEVRLFWNTLSNSNLLVSRGQKPPRWMLTKPHTWWRRLSLGRVMTSECLPRTKLTRANHQMKLMLSLVGNHVQTLCGDGKVARRLWSWGRKFGTYRFLFTNFFRGKRLSTGVL